MIAATKDLGFPRSVRLLKTDEFSSVFNFRRRIVGKFLIIHFYKNQLSTPRLGLVVPKKVTPLSVKRNYMKRVIREQFRSNRQSAGLVGLDLIVRTQQTFVSAEFPCVKKEFEHMLAELGRRNHH